MRMDGRPRIGLTCSALRAEGYYDPYLRAIESAGAEAVVIAPPTQRWDHGDTERILAGIDGLVIPGGWDVAPAEYGATPTDETTPLDRALDQAEAALVRGAIRASVPVFGICRGQQLINVALGGSLLQHIDGHAEAGQPRGRLAHTIAVKRDSDLGQVAPPQLMVNSMHHQAVRDLAPGLRATAHSPDGIIEALESTDSLVVAVQCHPEELVADHAWARALFARFVERGAARSRRPSAANAGQL
jgi:putative glutamine amidotransferase